MNSLVVLWINADKEAARQMVFDYCLNAKAQGWWKDVRLVVWGPSARTLSENQDLQLELKKLKNAGVALEASKGCADRYQIADNLIRLGFDVKLMGPPLTQMLKSDCKILSV